MSESDAMEAFVEQLTAHQSRLYAFIYSLLGEVETAKDTLQETNRVLWRKAGDFNHALPFLPWALTIARFQVRAARTKLGRERLCLRDDAALEAAANELESSLVTPAAGERELALESCLEKLSPDQRTMIGQYYRDGMSTEEIGSQLKRRPNTVAVTLHRIRVALGDCIRSYLNQAPRSETSSP